MGTEVTLTGSGLTGADSVTLGATPATYAVGSDTEIVATVPAGAESGAFTVTTPEGSATSAQTFTVIPAPAISGFSPSTAPVGATVTVTGSGLDQVTSAAIGGTAAGITAQSASQLALTVAAGTSGGAISVTGPGGTATSSGAFTVDTPPGTVAGFKTYAPTGDRTVFLTWNNPPVPDLKQVRIRRTTGATSTAPGPNGGTSAYAGTGQQVKVSGLTNGTTYRFWAYVSDNAGQWSGYAGPVTAKPVPPKATTLTLTRSAGIISYGGSVRLTAKLTTGGTAVSSERISFYGRRKGSTTWSLLTTATTTSGGTVSTVRQPAGHHEYYARHAQTLYYASSAATKVLVSVKPVLTAKLSPTAALNGTTVRATGTLKPAHSGRYIYLQRHTSNGWQTVVKTQLSSTGGYSLSTRPTSSGSYTYRIYKPADGDHLSAVSSNLVYRAYRVAISSIHYDAAGDDRYNLSDEYAVLKNTGRITVNLRGWRLYAGDAGQTFTLPSYSLAPGATVRVRTGSSGSGIRLYYGKPIWNNDGETGKLYDPRGAVSSTYRYTN